MRETGTKVGAVGWSRLAEDVYSELQIFILLPPPGLGVAWEERSHCNGERLLWWDLETEPKLEGEDDASQTGMALGGCISLACSGQGPDIIGRWRWRPRGSEQFLSSWGSVHSGNFYFISKKGKSS